VVSLERARPGLTGAALGAAAMLVVVFVAVAYGTDGPLSTVAAIVLAPVAVALTRRLGRRLVDDRFGVAAAIVYILLPALGRLYALADYQSTFTHEAVPNLVGLRGTPWFALGLVLAAMALFRVSAVLFVVAAVVSIAMGTGDLAGVRAGLHETAWSVSLTVWFGVAGVIGAARKSVAIAASLAGWLVLAVLHGARQGYADAAFWQSLSVATPAIAVTLTSLELLVPPLRPALARLRAL
jgi:hypothetical protein